VIVDLTEQVDLAAFGQALREWGLPKAARRSAVITALERVAERQQNRLRPEIDRLRAEGGLLYVRPVAIVNRLLVEAVPRGVLALAGSDEVARILPEWTSEGTRGRRAPGSAAAREGSLESWALEAMGLEELWSRGLDGRGVVVATIDTGAYGQHEQLRGRMLSGGRGWFDPVQGEPRPYDSHGHGTSVLSVAVGSNPPGHRIGVAPGARWAAALGNWKNFYSRWRMTEAADWILRVARPDVLINPWSNNRTECSDFDLPFINAWKAAEIFVVFPAGNAGPDPSTGEAPASLAGTLPDGGPVFSVAALLPGGEVEPTSSRGPSRCGSPLFPSLAAPGAGLPYAALGSPTAYAVGGGTSLAAGLVGGAAALLLQADPELSPAALERLLIDGAKRLPSPADATGAGGIRLDGLATRLEASTASGRSSLGSAAP
jgi:bacillopeptidase F